MLLGDTMYDYDFSKEKVIKEVTNLNLKYNKSYFLGSILLTTQNLLIFFDSNKDNALKGSGVQVISYYILLAKFNLKDITYQVKGNETIINKEITIYNFDLNVFLKK